jgi:hypothetical protein
MIELSVILVSYRCKSEVLECLRTLFCGGLDGLVAEVFLLDNASGDGVIDEVRVSFPDVQAEELPGNIGFSAANNIALGRARGRRVLFLNPDTLVPPGVLKKCVDFLESQAESVGGMGCRVVTPDGITQWECNRRLTTPLTESIRALWPFSPPEALPKAALEETGQAQCILGAFMLFRKSTLEAIGGFDERFFLMYEDIDLCQRVKNAGFSLIYWPDVSIIHLGGSSWKKEKIETYANSQRSGLKYIQKHFPRSVWQVRLIARLGMELRILVLRLRKPDSWTIEHLAMAREAREVLRNL